ncbi:hypothetical protein [Alkalimarinus alittae]|uniref:Uncharacterized protein n=1 Tax=Alkalimarinus alittae TaxID=2961619 RepID=A0ABY6N525_9ALTE|nr:hypothetical protein [Alkalimarinus alittae]UZE97227.1 hypothetical protein NKI27_05620 [Alkalimarinus alittae]
MNRFKKEENRKHTEARIGLSTPEIKHLDSEDATKAEINELAHKIHIEKYPEEYDHMYDSGVDCKERNKGINPMSSEYIAKVEAKRATMGVTPLSPAGMPVSDDSFKIAYAEAERCVRGNKE